MENTLPSINLFKTRQESFLEKFLKWALSIGRVFVIVTEIIALGAFLYRFSLDRRLVDLHDQIKQKQAIVKLLKGNEDKFRNLQERLTIAQTFSTSAIETTTVFNDIFSIAKTDLAIQTFIYSSDAVRLTANVYSISSLTTFINNLKKHPVVSTVSLDKIENKTSSAVITVSITANLKK